MDISFVENVAKDLGIQLSPYRTKELARAIDGQELSYDSIQYLVTKSYDMMGPQSLAVGFRLSEEEFEALNSMKIALSSSAVPVTNKMILKEGMRLLLDEEVLVDILPERSPRTKTIRIPLDIEMNKLFKRVIAAYSSDIGEVTNANCLLLAFTALHNKYTPIFEE